MANETVYRIERKSVDPQPTLSVRGPTTEEEIPDTITERTRRVWNHIQESDARAAGPPYSRYHAVGEVEIDLEVGFPVTEPVEGEGELEAGELPGGEVIATVHVGPYEELPEAGAALDRWLEQNDREAPGPGWEVYRVTQGHVDEPERYETDVIRPLA